MQTKDFEGVNNIDKLSQKQYLGEKWDSLTENEKKKCLVSNLPDFKNFLKSGYSYVAIEDKNIVGFLFAYPTLPYDNKLHIKYIAVNPTLQGKGIGFIMYQHLIEDAIKNKVERIVANINLDNPKSIKLHEKLKFILKDRKQATLEL